MQPLKLAKGNVIVKYHVRNQYKIFLFQTENQYLVDI